MPDDTRVHTFFFADLAGYTALTEAMGDSDAADLAHQFYSATSALVAEHGAEQIKMIGDAVLVRTDDAARRFASRCVSFTMSEASTCFRPCASH
ncbi:MAG TPA: adenylate/guanylate cyclase domain-containing protein [Solirubrobacteraceae bacterium]|nr:adenylate/guanylate cyclase domain-containing protein [Solirubrobacteraceae bacterium]